MFIVDTALGQRAAEGRPVRVALIGAGFMARAVAHQIVNVVPGMELVAISNRTLSRAARAWTEAGVERFEEVGEVGALNDAIARSRPVITDDGLLLCEAEGVDVLIEVTGSVEFGAEVAMKAISCKKDIVTMSAEVEGTVGSVIRRHADEAGVIYCLTDGDQPGVEMNLWRYVTSIGLTPLVCGNIKGLQDPYRNPTTQKGFAEKWGQDPHMVTSAADGTKISFEQACVANAVGMSVEMRGMRGGDFEGHVDELCHSGRYDVDAIRALGGVVDYTVQTKPAPGVFILAAQDDPRQRTMLELYKLGPGPLYSFYTPYHLCHFEVPLSAARVALFRDRVISAGSPHVDVVTIAKTDLRAGTEIDALGGYATYGECERYDVTRTENLLPIGLAEGCRVKREIPKDTALTYADVDLPPRRLCDRLRAEQDALFPVPNA